MKKVIMVPVVIVVDAPDGDRIAQEHLIDYVQHKIWLSFDSQKEELLKVDSIEIDWDNAHLKELKKNG